jgi:hypothetical protein
MSSIIRLDAVEVLGVGLNTSSSPLWNPTDRPQDKSADPGRGACGWLHWIFCTFRSLERWRTGRFPNDFNASRAIASAAQTECSDD